MYLTGVVRKLIQDDLLAKQAETLKTDRELFDFLSNIVSVSEIEEAFSYHYGIKYIKPNLNKIDKSLINAFDKALLQKQGVLPYFFDKEKEIWHFAISNLIDKDVQKTITRAIKQKKQNVVFTFAFKYEIDNIYSQLSKVEVEIPVEEDENFNATEWVETVMNKGIRLRASDIHIERQKKGIKVRYRVDGSMTNKHVFDVSDNEVSNIYVRLKIVGNMDIVQKRKSQDGRVDNYELDGKFYDLRVSTVNTILGEKFVMRIFEKDNKLVMFEDLGFDEERTEELTEMINKNNGVVYLAGATGAGKTTTLYAMINQLDKDALNVYTVESPVEKSINDVNQIQVDEASDVTYPSVLRSLLRQDPDIIVIGEIRDAETSELAVAASLTGHLVLTTVHANNALDSITRLTDMGIESYLIGASSVGFLSQRLVKLLCPECKVKLETIPEYQEIWIKEEMPEFDYEEMKKQGKYIYGAGECQSCIKGYNGRVAVVEIIKVDDKLRTLISKQVEVNDIKNYLKSIDYKNMKRDGINKALSGIISIEELMGQLQN